MEDFEMIEDPMADLILGEPTSPILKQSSIKEPSFTSSVIQGNRSDGYWVEAFHFDTKKDRVPGIIASGLVSGVIQFLDNPIAEAESKARESLHCYLKPSVPADVTKGTVSCHIELMKYLLLIHM